MNSSFQRYLIVALCSLAALWMYIDRVCFSTLSGDIQRDLRFSDNEKSFALGAFFLAYALCQARLPEEALPHFGESLRIARELNVEFEVAPPT